MINSKKYCVIDAGNTQVKIVDFEEDNIICQQTLETNSIVTLQQILDQRKNIPSIVSSVLDEEDHHRIFKSFEPSILLTHQTPLPLLLDEYKTPQTLGADRIANAVAAAHFSSHKNALVIDVGTCIKYDLTVDNRYIGGAISPGFQMRTKALHTFTGNLPFVELTKETPFIGKSTQESIRSGIIHGVNAEINGNISRFSQQYSPLTIFLTGGDLKKFDNNLKNSIFADENLTTKGLLLILKYNL